MHHMEGSVAGTVQVAVAGVAKTVGTQVTVDAAAGLVTFQPGHVPTAGKSVTAGFEFDVPVRFDTDKLDVNLSGLKHGAIPNIPLIEIRL